MTGFLWNILLAVVWAAVTGNFSPENLVFGFVVGFLVLFFARRVIGTANYGPRMVQALGLAAFFLRELVRSNVRVAYDVLRPNLRLRPGVIAIPLDAYTDAEIVLLANLITVTPGSLSLDVSADRQTLYLHVMHFDDPEEVRRSVKEGYERRILTVTR
ncbi:MAG: Na+/H+ antiporter subunit E [Dehalococcoidia bacterium]